MVLEKEEIKEWVIQYTDDLYRWAFSKTSSKEVAEDLVQDTYLSALESLEKFRGDSSPKTWLFTILNHKIIDYYRKKIPTGTNTLAPDPKEDKCSAVVEDSFDQWGQWRKESRPQSWTGKEGNLMDNVDFAKTLQECIDKLPDSWQASIKLKYLNNKKGPDICKDLGISSSNFWQILYRARMQLRACLELNWFKK